ncbi:dna cross-link repair pso2 snm1 [Paramyrothecium foliicola]|nr:dna cross-link repair pso2 snm1 [Paramyrothecium foliicola]
MVTSTKLGRTSTPKKSGKGSQAPKRPVKANTSILSFFRKAEKQEASLFVGVTSETVKQPEDLYEDDGSRYNEVESPNKKRRISEESVLEQVNGGRQKGGGDEDVKIAEPTVDVRVKSEVVGLKTESETRRAAQKHRIFTPFAMDSDSEDESEPEQALASPTVKDSSPRSSTRVRSSIAAPIDIKEDPEVSPALLDAIPAEPAPPTLKQVDSTYAQFDELGELMEDEDQDQDQDAFEGEELRFMRYMREQARLEAEEAGGFTSEDFADDSIDDGSLIQSCPICDGTLVGVSVEEATRHVNSCLDGNPLPLPKPAIVDTDKAVPVIEASEISKRFAKAAVPRPGQANPLDVAPSTNASKSAFSKLMSNNAEDSAWAAAAAAENASRGRPAYERTCPFYKIMPGFSICVDAFRYGAVEGCKAYFLSHFHSDHYIGLTANWTHGPIYCSKVTGSLVKQQLRTASKWVVELEFDKSYDVPGTDGASVTMIPANHCPGSSLFLFQKAEGNGSATRTKRILHCGDFRACPDHIKHPLLKPDIQDNITGKLKQQKIDICYLDTTYLNPRYSFPPQGDVIKACADLCASVSPDPESKDDIWETSTKPAGTPAVSKYFQSKKQDDAATSLERKDATRQKRLLVICGTYSIGKERICVAIAKALGSKIFASPSKIKICKQLDDPELTSLLTSDPVEAQVHMQMLMEIRAETLQEYLNSFKPHFSRIIGFRPSGWNFRPRNGKAIGANTPPSSIPTQQILHGKGWRTRFEYRDFVPQRGSTKEAMCFGVPYSEHSSFRELAMFVMGLRIEKIVPTVNVGSATSRSRMKAWVDRWMLERRRGGLLQPLIEGQDDENDKGMEMWDGKIGKGGGAWW